MRRSFIAMLVAPVFLTPAYTQAAKKAAKAPPAPAAKDQRKKPAKTLNLITQYRVEFHKKGIPNGARPGCGGRGDANCRVDDVYQQTIMLSKKLNANVTGLIGGVYKYNLNEDKSDNVTWILGASRVFSKKLNGSAMYISNNRYTVFDNAQTSGDSDNMALSLAYKAMVKKKGMRDAIDTNLTYSFNPGMDRGGTFSPKVAWKHDLNKRLVSTVDTTLNFDMASRKNRTAANGAVSSRNTLNIYGFDLKYQINKKYNLNGTYQLKDFATGPNDNVFRMTLSRIY